MRQLRRWSGAHDIQFALFAPYCEAVALMGSWRRWQRQPMQRDERGWWRVAIPLRDGEYTYKFAVQSKSFFMVDRWVEVPDPRALQWTEDDTAACLLVRQGRRCDITYHWRHDDVPLPANDALIIYELQLSDFTGIPRSQRGSRPIPPLVQAVERLDYLRDLGVNAVELMPCNEFPGDYSWGYNPFSPFPVANAYGTPDDLCRFVDECHGRGIRVIHDGVYNHSTEDGPLTKIDYTYWYYQENPDEPDQRYGPKFDYEHFDVHLRIWPARELIRDAVICWIDRFHLDGIRFDATYLIRNFDFLHWLHSEIFNYVTQKPFITIAEHIPQDPAICGPDGPLDAAWHEDFSFQLLAVALGRDYNGHHAFDLDALVAVLDPPRQGYRSAFDIVNYLENHDRERVMYLLGKDANTFDRAAFRRLKLVATLLLTAPGMPMLWMGQEFGASNVKTLARIPLDWKLPHAANNADLLRHYQQLLTLRAHRPELHSDTLEIVAMHREQGIIAFKRWNGHGGITVVVANLRDDSAADVVIGDWPGDGIWQEWNATEQSIEGGTLHTSLEPSEAKIYLSQV